MCPSTTTEMRPVSSDTTMAMASFSSVSRLRHVPRSELPELGFTVGGRKQAAAAIRSSGR